MKRTNGTIIEHKCKGIDSPTVIKVEYNVNGEKYQIKETVKLVSKIIKLGFLPIGQKKLPQIDCKLGSIVTVIYDEEHPEKAHIEGNDGILNI